MSVMGLLRSGEYRCVKATNSNDNLNNNNNNTHTHTHALSLSLSLSLSLLPEQFPLLVADGSMVKFVEVVDV